MKKEKINHLAVFIVVMIQQAIGALWYSPLLFGKQWLDLVKKNIYILKALGNYPYFISLLSSFVLSYFLVWLIKLDNTKSPLRGAKLGFLTWCGIVVPITCTHYVFAAAEAGLVFIDVGHSLAGLVVSGALIARWDKNGKK